MFFLTSWVLYDSVVPFLLILGIVMITSTLYFVISLPDSPAFSYNAEIGGGVFWPFLSVFQTVLGGFNVQEYTSTSSLVMFILLILFGVVLMFNLLICIMSEGYGKVQAKEEVEGLMEKARLIEDLEQVYGGDTRHYLHVAEAAEDLDANANKVKGASPVLQAKHAVDKLRVDLRHEMHGMRQDAAATNAAVEELKGMLAELLKVQQNK